MAHGFKNVSNKNADPGYWIERAQSTNTCEGVAKVAEENCKVNLARIELAISGLTLAQQTNLSFEY